MAGNADRPLTASAFRSLTPRPARSQADRAPRTDRRDPRSSIAGGSLLTLMVLVGPAVGGEPRGTSLLLAGILVSLGSAERSRAGTGRRRGLTARATLRMVAAGVLLVTQLLA